MNVAVIPYLGESMSLLAAVVWAIAVICFKKSGEAVHPIGLNLYKDLLAAVLFVPTIYLWGEELFLDAPAADYLILLASGALGIGIADTLFFACLNRLGAGLTAIIDCFYSPFIIVFSMIWLGERLTPLQAVGTILIISAVLTATYHRQTSHLDRKNLIVGITYGILAMGTMALGIVMMKPVLNRSPLLWATEIRLIGGVVVLLIVLVFYRSRRSVISSMLSQKGRVYTIGGSLLGGYLAMVIWLAGMKYAMVSIAGALNQTTTIFIFILAALFLKEKITLPRTIGILLAVSGAILVTFS